MQQANKAAAGDRHAAKFLAEICAIFVGEDDEKEPVQYIVEY